MGDFDYDQDGPDVDTVRSIAAEIENAGKPPPLSDEERLALESELFERRQHDKQLRLAYERHLAEKAEARAAQERQTAALERQERARQLQERMRQDSDQRLRDAKLDSLHQANIRNEAFRSNLMRSQALANQRQDLSTALDNWMATKYPPPPAPEPAIVVIGQEDDTFCGVKIPHWRK